MDLETTCIATLERYLDATNRRDIDEMVAVTEACFEFRTPRAVVRGHGELRYEVARQRGSHRRLKAPGRPPITFVFHDRATLGPAAVRKVLCRDVGLRRRGAQATVRLP